MKRRIVLKTLGAGLLLAGAGPLWRQSSRPPSSPEPATVPLAPAGTEPARASPVVLHDPEPGRVEKVGAHADRRRLFDADHAGDVWLTPDRLAILGVTVSRMQRLQRHIGHGRFSMLGFDRMLAYARNYSSIGAFSRQEKDFLEEIFSHDARDYGFMGNKVMERLTETVARKDAVKIPDTGNYLFRGESRAMYQRLKKDLGEQMILTSGIRGMAKQMYLFLAKAQSVAGNLSRASRSLAPPGHSYHGIGDFDVGQRGLGRENFTARFAHTEAFHKLVELGYVDIRYTSGNRLGVRYEPWHIKVV